MLPDIRLDDEDFDEILEKVRKMISGLSSDWTDFNYHDPGITFLELFAWIKEMQQYHMDQIGCRHRTKYWKLLGISCNDRKPACTMLTIQGRKEGFLARGSRFYADKVCFETVEQEYVSLVNVEKGIREDESGRQCFSMEQEGGRLRIPLFGKSPKGGERFLLALTAPLKKKVEHHLYLKIYDGYPVKRNPVKEGDSFLPLAKFRLEALTEQGFEEAVIVEDETHQLLFSGYLKFRLTEDMKEREGWYWLRFVLLEAGYDTAPEIEAVSFCAFFVRQQRTLAECMEGFLAASGEFFLDSALSVIGQNEIYVEKEKGLKRYEGKLMTKSTQSGISLMPEENLKGKKLRVFSFEPEFAIQREVGEGTGFPFQELELDIPGFCREGFVLMVETQQGSSCYQEWTRVEDFDNSGPEDLHYVLRGGTLQFGDCYHGCAPEGRIFIGAVKTSLGSEGNVKAGSINQWESKLLKAVVNEEHASGGTMEETAKDCEAKVRELFLNTQRAVTYADYEELALRTPGLRIRAVKAVPVTALRRQDGSMDETRVVLTVDPFSEEKRRQPSPAYLKNILQMLETKRMIGTRVQILPSEYVGVSVFAEVTADSYYEQVRFHIGSALEEYFGGQGWEFGRPVRYGDIYGLLDTLPGVSGVRTITLDAKGKGVRITQNGDLLLPIGGLAYLKDWECMISSAE